MLREVADLSGLIENVTAVLADTYKGPWLHDPGRVFADLAVAVADGADCVSGIGTLVDQQRLHGMVASLTTVTTPRVTIRRTLRCTGASIRCMRRTRPFIGTAFPGGVWA